MGSRGRAAPVRAAAAGRRSLADSSAAGARGRARPAAARRPAARRPPPPPPFAPPWLALGAWLSPARAPARLSHARAASCLPAAQIRALDAHKAVAAAGPQSDCANFVEFVQRNVALNAFRTGLEASTRATASYVRTELAAALRKAPYQVNLLLGGWDAGAGPALYYVDYTGAAQRVDFSAHGYAAAFVLSTMDRYWRPGMALDDALALARTCVKELATRYIIHQPAFTVKVVDKDGVRVVAL